MGESTLIASTAKLTRQQLAAVPTPLGTATHRPVPHAEVVEALVETLSFRHIGVVTEEYAVSKDGMKMFGVLDLDTGMPGCRFSIGVRNSHDRSMRLAAVAASECWSARTWPSPATFSRCWPSTPRTSRCKMPLSIGVDQMQRNFDPHAAAGGELARSQLSRRSGEAGHLPGVHRDPIWKRPSTWRAGFTSSTSYRKRQRKNLLVSICQRVYALSGDIL